MSHPRAKSFRKPVAIVVLCACAFGCWKLLKLPTVHFADGSRLEIRKVVVGKDYAQTIRLKWNWNPFHRAERVGWSEAGGVGNTRVLGVDFGSTREMAIKADSDALMVGVAGLDSAGQPISWSANPLPFNLAVWAGEFGQWRDGFRAPKPYAGFDDVFVFPVFARKDPEIRLRVTQKGQPPVELTVKNPSPTTAQQWTAGPLPALKPFSEGMLRLSGGEWKIDERNGCWVYFITAAAEKNPEQFQYRLLGISDATGNYLEVGRLSERSPTTTMPGVARRVPIGTGWGISLPPGNGPWRVQIEVSHSEYHPSELKNALPIAEGTIQAGNNPPTFVPSKEMNALGTPTLSAKIVRQLPDSADILINFDIKGTVPLDVIRNEQTGMWRIYIDGMAIIADASRNPLSSFGHTNEIYHAECYYQWVNHLKPGTVFVIAAPRLVKETVEFTITPPPFAGGNR